MQVEILARFLRDHMLYMDFVVLFFAIWAFKHLDKRLLLLFINAIVGIFVVIISYYQVKLGNNLYMSYLYAPYEVIIMSVILIPQKGTKIRKFVALFVGLTLIVNVLEGLLIEDGFSRYNSITYCLVNSILGTLAIYQLLKLRYNPLIESLSRTPMFWVALGIGIHSIGLFLVWAFMRSAQDTSMELLWHLALIREIVIYITLALWIIAFYMAKTQRSMSDHVNYLSLPRK